MFPNLKLEKEAADEKRPWWNLSHKKCPSPLIVWLTRCPLGQPCLHSCVGMTRAGLGLNWCEQLRSARYVNSAVQQVGCCIRWRGLPVSRELHMPPRSPLHTNELNKGLSVSGAYDSSDLFMVGNGSWVDTTSTTTTTTTTTSTTTAQPCPPPSVTYNGSLLSGSLLDPRDSNPQFQAITDVEFEVHVGPFPQDKRKCKLTCAGGKWKGPRCRKSEGRYCCTHIDGSEVHALHTMLVNPIILQATWVEFIIESHYAGLLQKDPYKKGTKIKRRRKVKGFLNLLFY